MDVDRPQNRHKRRQRRNRRRIWLPILVLLGLLAAATPFAISAWNSKGTPVTSSTEEPTQEPPRPTTGQTPTSPALPTEETASQPLQISGEDGKVTGSCPPSGTEVIVCTLTQAVTFSADGYAKYPGGAADKFLLITCGERNCASSSVLKNQIPCVKGDGSTVRCINVTNRTQTYEAVEKTAFYCRAEGDAMLCPKRDGYTVDNGSLKISGTWGAAPVVLTRTESSRRSAYAIQAPAGFAIFGNCSTEVNGDIKCRPSDASGITPVGWECTPVSNVETTCTSRVGTAPQTLTVWCPGSDSTVYCHTEKSGMSTNRLNCTRDPAAERKLVCRRGA